MNFIRAVATQMGLSRSPSREYGESSIMLPSYLEKANANPASGRAAWYANTAPTFAGIYLWIVFYLTMAVGTIDRATLGVCLVAVAAAALLCYLFYYAPAMLGMKTGYPLYVVGTSTFGTTGGYLMPGLLMGVLQAGWVAVNVWTSTRFILLGLGDSDPKPLTAKFVVIGVLWGYLTAFIGLKAIKYVARVSMLLNIVPLVMILIVFFRSAPGIAESRPQLRDNFGAVVLILQSILGFTATAAAAGADFGMNNRNKRDVRLGGLVGIALSIVVVSGLVLLSVAGGRNVFHIQSYSYDAVIAGMGGTLAATMFFLFAVASIVPACVSSFIMGNSFATMIPGVSRMVSGMAGATLAVVLGVTGIAGSLVGLSNIVGASFGPICGAIAADYVLSGKRWAGPRRGMNWAGYLAWAVGFLVGIVPFLPLSADIKRMSQPSALYSFIVAFVVYGAAAKLGLEPEAVKEFGATHGPIAGSEPQLAGRI
jgi:cytosine permease